MKTATKISIMLVGVVTLAGLACLEAFLLTREMRRVVTETIAENLASVRAAQELQIALLEQRGLVASHILDRGNPAWIDQLRGKRARFLEWLQVAETTARTAEEKEILGNLRSIYQTYDRRRDEVIDRMDRGDPAGATALLLGEATQLYGQVYRSCSDFIAANERFIQQRSESARQEIRRAYLLLALLVSLTLGAAVGLLVFFFRGILRPLRQMADDARSYKSARAQDDAPLSSPDELRTVGHYLRSLMADVTETQSDLERSRVQLLDSEKMVSLGRLAASIGHEIRNPLTSIEMRLYSIRQAVGDLPELEEDLRVVSEEITRLEKIVRNVLDFSRPPELDMKAQHPVPLVDKTLELCGHWLDECAIEVVRREDPNLPPVMADTEQIKQVLLNLIRNAVEAMEGGGELRLTTTASSPPGRPKMVVIRVQDSGPGVPPAVRERILEPFFSTKPDGTGLGLCIAARIMAQHGGRLELEPPGAGGASFAAWIPAAGGYDG